MIDWQLTDLLGNPLGGLEQGRPEGSSVKLTHNDDRTATLMTTIEDPALEVIAPLSVMVKAVYRGHRVFSGVVQVPDHHGQEGTVEVQARGPSRRLDAAPILDTRVRWRSLDQIIEACRPARYGFPDAPDHGVQADASVVVYPSAYDRITGTMSASWMGLISGGRGPMPGMDLSSGISGWGVIKQAAESLFGPDFDLRPIEHEVGSYDYAVLDLANRRGTDKRGLDFHFGFGQANLVDAGFAPGGDRVVNAYFAETASGDETSPPSVAGYYSPPEIDDVGFYAAYEGSSGCSGAAGGGIMQVAAYRTPPRFFTFQPAIEGPSGGFGYHPVTGGALEGLGIPPRVFDDYDIGDTVRVIARRSYFTETLEGRITDIELTEVDSAGNVQVTVSAVPSVDIDDIDTDLTNFESDLA